MGIELHLRMKLQTGRILAAVRVPFNGCILAVVMAFASPAAAQPEAALEALPDSSKSKVIRHDPLLQFRLEPKGNERTDLDHGVIRAAYQLQPDMRALDSPEATARAWLQIHAGRFGISRIANLTLIRHVKTGGIHHLTFGQTHQGVPVYNRTIQVNLGRDGLPSMVLSAYAPHLDKGPAVGILPKLLADDAKEQAALAVSDQAVQTGDATLHIYPSAPPRLIWKVMAWPETAPGAWEVMVDARNGAIIHLIDRLLHDK